MGKLAKRDVPSTSLGVRLKSISPTLIRRKTDSFEVSVYSGKLTQIGIPESMAKLKKSFKTLDNGFFDVLSDRILENNFSDEKLKASINHVIDNCIYPSPTIAQFLNYDKTISVYSYDDMLKMFGANKKAFEMHKAIRIGERTKPMFADIADIETYKLELWKYEKKEK